MSGTKDHARRAREFTESLMEDALASMRCMRATLGEVLGPSRPRLYHGTRGDWVRALIADGARRADGTMRMPRKSAEACRASNYCARGHGGTMGHGQYFSSSFEVALREARGPESLPTKPAPKDLTVLRVDVLSGTTCGDGTPVVDLVGARMAHPFMFGCMFCVTRNERWTDAVVSTLEHLASRVDFLFMEPMHGSKGYEIVFTRRGLARGVPIAAALTSRGTPI